MACRASFLGVGHKGGGVCDHHSSSFSEIMWLFVDFFPQKRVLKVTSKMFNSILDNSQKNIFYVHRTNIARVKI